MYAQQGPPQPAFIPYVFPHICRCYCSTSVRKPFVTILTFNFFHSQVQQATMQPQYTGGQPQYINQGVPHQTSGYVGDMKQEGPPAQQQIFVNGARSAPQQPPMQPIGAPQQYYSASPLAVLGQGSAPVDCPACRHRNMTITNAEIGNTNQYAHSFPTFSCCPQQPFFL